MEAISNEVLQGLREATNEDVLFWHTAYPGSFATQIGPFQLRAWHGPESDMMGVQIYESFGEGRWHKDPTSELIKAIRVQQERHKGLELGRQGPLLHFLERKLRPTPKPAQPLEDQIFIPS